ncbi:hypothetical protein [Rhodobacter lacus]|uniref:Permease n=1 Tax=Rhodobacter lacus TaxID=1641972 RepID=A0ABW5ABH1_9RHOB
MKTGETGGLDPPADVLAETEALYREIAAELAAAMAGLRARAGSAKADSADVKAAAQAVKDLRAAFQMVMEERGRVEKLRKQASGALEGQALDLDAARAEIGRRLARLRDAR